MSKLCLTATAMLLSAAGLVSSLTISAVAKPQRQSTKQSAQEEMLIIGDDPHESHLPTNKEYPLPNHSRYQAQLASRCSAYVNSSKWRSLGYYNFQFIVNYGKNFSPYTNFKAVAFTADRPTEFSFVRDVFVCFFNDRDQVVFADKN